MSGLVSLYADEDRYMKSFNVFLKNSSEHASMIKWIKHSLCKSINNLEGCADKEFLSVGSGNGELDVIILEEILKIIPRFNVTFVDPSHEQIDKCKTTIAMVKANSKAWDQVKVEFVEDTIEAFYEENSMRRFDFIYMVQMLYYVKDYKQVLQNILGMMRDSKSYGIILHVSSNSGYAKVWKNFSGRLPQNDSCNYVTANDITNVLATFHSPYSNTEISSDFKIFEDLLTTEEGKLAVDFITEAAYFVDNGDKGLVEDVIDLIKSNSCSRYSGDALCFNNNLSSIVFRK
uniref:Histamine n methyltransferase n=1 Tax=Hofstenia miamia TaxID=442651 RepID=A0A7G7LK83_HOFMI|nr:histamine n methyltransferase [Hofstenia miamia]